MLKEVIEGRIPKGRKRLGMLSELKEDGYAKMKRRTDTKETSEAGCQEEPVGIWNTRDRDGHAKINSEELRLF